MGRASGLRSRHWYSRSWIACGQSSGTLRRESLTASRNLSNLLPAHRIARTRLLHDCQPSSLCLLPHLRLVPCWEAGDSSALGLAPPVLCGQQTRQQLVQHDAQGPDIGGGRWRQAIYDLRRLRITTQFSASCNCRQKQFNRIMSSVQPPRKAGTQERDPVLHGLQGLQAQGQAVPPQ